jgi:hypothetical protein
MSSRGALSPLYSGLHMGLGLVQLHQVQQSLFGNGRVDRLKTLSVLCEDSFWTGLTELIASSSSLAAGGTFWQQVKSDSVSHV